MNFSNDKAIYVQIAERLSDEILAGKYKEDERIPSVREYAVTAGGKCQHSREGIRPACHRRDYLQQARPGLLCFRRSQEAN